MINEWDLNKQQQRKLRTLRKSLGTTIADRAFKSWLKQETAKKEKARSEDKPDSVARKILQALEPLGDLNLGLYGYTLKRAKGRGEKGLRVIKNTAKG